MLVEVRNPHPHAIILSGYAELGPGKSIRLPESIAQRFKNSVTIHPISHGPTETSLLASKRLSVSCSFHPLDGYGIGSTYVVKALMQRGYDISYDMPMGFQDVISEFAPDMLPVMQTKLTPTPRVGIARTVPTLFYHSPAPIRFGWTMWEGPHVPQAWVARCNDMDYLITPTSGIARAFQESGVSIPVHAIPEPLDLTNFGVVERSYDTAQFTFISVSRMCSRKCPNETVDCFLKAFPTEKDVRLVMKTRDNQFGMGMFGIPRVLDDRVLIINDNWPQTKVVKLLQDAHAAIFLSHGEGFYHGPIQAMATGLPTIVPDHSGCTDYANKKYNYPIPLDRINSTLPTPYFAMKKITSEPMEWYELDYGVVIDSMRDIYRNRDKARARGMAASKWIRSKYNLENTISGLEQKIKPLL